jgi:putative addiction module killer protein
MITLRQYLEESGGNPFAEWFDALDTEAFAKVTAALTRIEEGNFSQVKGGGVFERKVDFGPGYRVYFGRDGDTIIILLGGGTKKRQNRDIETAQERWKDYKRRKT